MQIKPADFSATDFAELMRHHLRSANQNTCAHALGIADLQMPDVQMFEARDPDGNLMGFAALKTLTNKQGEIKSVRTHDDHLRKGVSRALMAHIEDTAREAGLTALYLETHNTPAYTAACRLYERLGYSYCCPFGDYVQDDRNVFMMKAI